MMDAVHPPLEQSQRHLEEMLLDGDPFRRVEREIDSTPFGDDDKAALWLYAWSLDQRLERKPALVADRKPTLVP